MGVRGIARRQAGLLGEAPSFRLLFASTLVSGLGTWLSVVALTVDVFDRTRSGVWVGALLIADFLPAVAIGLALGPLVDRLSRKRLLVGGDLLRFAVFAALPFTTAPGQIVALAFVAGIATGFGVIWALGWRRQEQAVAAIEERDGVRFYVEHTSPFKPMQLTRTPGFGGDFLRTTPV